MSLRELTIDELVLVSGGEGVADAMQSSYSTPAQSATQTNSTEFGGVLGGAVGGVMGGSFGPGGTVAGSVIGHYTGAAIQGAINDPVNRDLAIIVGGMDGVDAGSAIPAGSVVGNDFSDPSSANASSNEIGVA